MTQKTKHIRALLIKKKTINSRPVVRGGHYTKWLVLVTWRSTENQRTRSYRSNTKNNLTTIHSRLRAKAQLDLVDISWSDGLSEFYNADTNCPMTGNFKTEVPNGSTTDENNFNVKSPQVTIKSQTYIALKITGGPCCFRFTYPVTKIP